MIIRADLIARRAWDAPQGLRNNLDLATMRATTKLTRAEGGKIVKIADFDIDCIGTREIAISPLPSSAEIGLLVGKIKDYYIGTYQECSYCDEEHEIRADTLFLTQMIVEEKRLYFTILTMCEDCYNNNFGEAGATRCGVCGLFILRGTHVHKGGGDEPEFICFLCAKTMNGYTKCSGCGNLYADNSIREYTNYDRKRKRFLCDDCAKAHNVCPKCDTYKVRRFAYRTKSTDGKNVQVNACANCIGEVQLSVCGQCNSYFTTDMLVARKDSLICERCLKALKEKCVSCGGANETANDYCMTCRTGYIREWNYQPDPIVFHGDGVHFGLELEITGFPTTRRREELPTGDKLRCALELYGISEKESQFYLMKDSTINGGLEVAFQPRTMDNWLHDGKNLLEQVRLIVRKYGAVSYKGGCCGIHIHRSMVDLTTDARISALFYALQAIEPYAYILAQRTGISNKTDVESGTLAKCEYGSFSRQKDFLPDHQCSPVSARQIIGQCRNWLPRIANEHHAAITLGKGKPTIELRIFRGTLAVDTTLAYLAFYSMLAEWSKSTSLSRLMDMSNARAWSEFTGFIRQQHSPEVTRLVKYIKTKGLVI